MNETIEFTEYDTASIKIPQYVGGYYNKELKIEYLIETKPNFIHRFLWVFY